MLIIILANSIVLGIQAGNIFFHHITFHASYWSSNLEIGHLLNPNIYNIPYFSADLPSGQNRWREVFRSVFLTIKHCISSAELTKTHSKYQTVFLAILPTG